MFQVKGSIQKPTELVEDLYSRSRTRAQLCTLAKSNWRWTQRRENGLEMESCLGISGFTVFKYRLKRLEGQPLLTTNQVTVALTINQTRTPQGSKSFISNSDHYIQCKEHNTKRLVCKDISGGLEDIAIPASNLVDDPPVAPTSKLIMFME